MKKKQKDQLILVTIIIGMAIGMILALFLVASLFELFEPDEEGMTAMEGMEIADDYAKNWSSNARFSSASGGVYDNGESSRWSYSYFADIDGNLSHMYIQVYRNGTIEESVFSPSGLSNKTTLINWEIDSPEAMEIALNNESISTFAEKYGCESVVMSLRMIDTSDHVWKDSPDPIWEITWSDMGWFDDPRYAHIHINATTGEIIHVKAGA